MRRRIVMLRLVLRRLGREVRRGGLWGVFVGFLENVVFYYWNSMSESILFVRLHVFLHFFGL